MKNTHNIALKAALIVATTQVQAQGFLEDSSGSILIRNYYFDRDFRDGSGQSQAQEWAQGFILKLNSGYTEGRVGFGLDLTSRAGFKLDSSADRTGTGLLPYGSSSHEPESEFAEAGLTAKMKLSRTELRVGEVAPFLPVILPVTSRLFPPSFRGVDLTSKDLEDLTFHAGKIDRINLRDSTNWEPMRVSSQFGRFNSSAQSTNFDYAGGDWKIGADTTASYYYAQLENIYQQHYVGLVKSFSLGPGTLKADLRFHGSQANGDALAGRVDNRTYQYNLSYSLDGHTASFGQMRLTGDTALPYLAGTDVNVITEGSLVSEFSNPHERVWQARYLYNFAAAGIPGLTFLYRYIDGSHVELGSSDGKGNEIERSSELAYVVQSGPLKNVGFRFRQGHYTSNYFRNVDETRVNIDYTLALF